MTGAVIYLFVSPSGRAYAGRHTCQHEGWPRRGSGALPSGYTGSGKLWQNVARKHGPNLRWIILRRFPEGTPRAQVDAAERRAVRLARSLWAGRCVNLLEGGEGLTSADASAMWADPDVKTKISAANKAAQNRPEVKARNSAANKEAQNRPEVKARKSAANKEAANRPDVKARNSAASKALAQTPERHAFLASIQASTNTPEARAKAAATRARNKALRAMETQQ